MDLLQIAEYMAFCFGCWLVVVIPYFLTKCYLASRYPETSYHEKLVNDGEYYEQVCVPLQIPGRFRQTMIALAPGVSGVFIAALLFTSMGGDLVPSDQREEATIAVACLVFLSAWWGTISYFGDIKEWRHKQLVKDVTPQTFEEDHWYSKSVRDRWP